MMAPGGLDRRAGGERPRLTIRQRLSIKHIQMVWEAIMERLGRGFRLNKKKRKRRRKQDAMRQMQKEIGPELKTLEASSSAKSGRDSWALNCCLLTGCGCLVDHSKRSRLTVTDSDAPPVYSNEDIIHDIVPPLQLTLPHRTQ